MAKRGRPPIEHPRTNLTFRVTDREKQAIESEAKAIGATISAFLRAMVRQRLGIATEQGREEKR